MAYTLEQTLSTFTSCSIPMVYVVKDTDVGSAGVYKYRYICQIEVEGTIIATLKIYPNASNCGVFDVSPIVKTYVQTQEGNVGDLSSDTSSGTIHQISETIDNTYSYSQTNKQLRKVKVMFGHEESTSLTLAPTVYTDVVNHTTWSIEGAFNFNVGIQTDTNVPTLPYLPNPVSSGAYGDFLTTSPYFHLVRGSDSVSADNKDYHTLAFVQKGSSSSTGTQLGDALYKVKVTYYNSSNVTISITNFICSTSYGGANTSQTATTNEGLQYFGCGPKNLETQTTDAGGKPTGNSNWAYYKVAGYNAGNIRITEQYYFINSNLPFGFNTSGIGYTNKQQNCSSFDTIRLAWRNPLGAWDYLNFTMKNIKTTKISERSKIGEVSGTWDNTTFTTNLWDKNTKTLYTKAKEELKVSTSFLNDEEVRWLETLFYSTDVQIIYNNLYGEESYKAIPVNVNENRFVEKKRINDVIKTSYQIKLEFSHEINTNS